MAKPKQEPVLSPLVTKGFALRLKIAGLLTELAAIETQMVALGAGPYADKAGNECTVVAATNGNTGAVKYVLPSESEETANLLCASAARTDDIFKKLFTRHVSYSPCEGFPLLAPKLLTPAKALKIVALCLVPGKFNAGKAGHVKWKD